jgi:YbbR domain-containing protein
VPKINHPGLKIASVLCGISLWFYVVSGREFQISMELPLRFVNLPRNMAIASRPPSSLPVQIAGKAIDLIRLKVQDSSAWMEIDLRDAGLGQQTISLTDARFLAPGFSGLRFQGTQGLAALELEVDTRIERRIPVKLRAEIQSAPGYALIGDPVLEPQEIVLSGARNVLTRIFEIPTRAERVVGLKWDNALPIGLDLSGLPAHVGIGDSSVQMRVRVEPLERRVFTGVTVQLIGNYDRNVHSLSPATATVEITGGKNVLAQILQSDIHLFIEHSRFAIEDADSLAPTVRIRKPVQSWRVHPEKFYLVTRPLVRPVMPESTMVVEGTL